LIDQQGLEEAGKDLQNLLGVHEKVEAIDQLDAERILPAVNEAVSTALEQNQQLLQLKMISVSKLDGLLPKPKCEHNLIAPWVLGLIISTS